METTTQVSGLAQSVLQGLSAKSKFLSSRYFYDDEGSKIFQDIMRMPEYYLTDCELEIFETQKQAIYEAFSKDDHPFDLVELGAGDGMKTKVLLQHILTKISDFNYLPIDISEIAVLNLISELKHEFPNLKTEGKIGDYFQIMEELSHSDNTPRVLLFLGSNIGNFSNREAIEFLHQLRGVMNPADQLFIGFDLKKNPDIILKAYDDPHGHTAAFNLNLLHRINMELNADFNLLNFKHHESYNPKTGTAESFLVSLKPQDVHIGELHMHVHFEAWECIHMEQSQKYDGPMIQSMAEQAGFKIVRNFYDSRQYFANSLWKLK